MNFLLAIILCAFDEKVALAGILSDICQHAVFAEEVMARGALCKHDLLLCKADIAQNVFRLL